MDSCPEVEELVVEVGGDPPVAASRLLVLPEGSFRAHPKRLILIIPGNPGISRYYEDFMKALYMETRGEVTVWCLGYAGQDAPPPGPEPGRVHGIQSQIEHKVGFIEQHVGKGTDLTLVGHSIGCKLGLEIMKRFSSPESVQRGWDVRGRFRSYFLFPAIQQIRKTPSGRMQWPAALYFSEALAWAAWIVRRVLPRNLIAYALKNWLGMDSECSVRATLDLLRYPVVKDIYHLFYTECLEVLDLDAPALIEHVDRVRLYYGATDGWSPLSHYRELVDRVAGIRAEVDSQGTPHAFVLRRKDSQFAARTVASWLLQDLSIAC